MLMEEKLYASMLINSRNVYYLQDELGSPMYMTGTDGVAVSAYAFDDFGRNIDPFTGKRRDKNQKHAYTTNGNIIQPFAFTGYQEDEVSGLKFAQARYYSEDKGAITGGLGVLGLGGVAAFATKAVVNVGVDIASSWGNAVLDHESYTATDAIKTGLTSDFSTTVGHFIGKIKWPSEKLVGGLGIDVKDGSAKNIYQGLSKIEPLRAVGGLHGVAQVINLMI